MRKHPRLFFWIIILFTILAIYIDLPSFPIRISTPKFPIINKAININKDFTGGVFNFALGQLHINVNFPFIRGLDLQGGTSVTLTADMKGIPQDKRQDALDGAKQVIENRVNLFGVKEPVVQTETVNNDYRVVVELPGVNATQAEQLVGKTAQLSFWEQGASGSAGVNPTTLPLGIPELLGANAHKTDLTGKDLTDATVTFDQNTGAPQVQLTFTTDGAKKFGDITTRNVGKRVAIVLDNQVVEAPVVNQPIISGNAVITGNFTTDTATQLSIDLKAGVLPVPLHELQHQTIGATLGQSALEKSLFAGLLGFFVIVIFMSILYGRFGLTASLALFLYTSFVLAIFKIIPVTLTLAGIAGFILSIGMAVDANILIFERMKEELRNKATLKSAIELGFSRAWPSIRDSNVSTLITSFILYEFGTGTVKGFAFTLAIGVLVSMFSAIAITRTFLRYFYNH